MARRGKKRVWKRELVKHLLLELAEKSKYPLTLSYASRLLNICKETMRLALWDLVREGKLVAWRGRPSPGPLSHLYFTVPRKARMYPHLQAEISSSS